MNRPIIKYIFLIIFAVINIFGINKSIPTVQLLQMYLFLAAVLVVLFFVKTDLLNLLLLWFVAVLFRDFGMIPLPGLPDIFAERVIWVAIVVIFLFSILFKKLKLVRPITGVEIVMAVFSLYSLLSMVISAKLTNSPIKLNFLLNGYVIPFSIFYFTRHIVTNEKEAKKYFTFFAVLGLYLGLTGIFEVLKISKLVFPGYIMNPFIGDHYGRARGPYLMATVNGLVIGSIVLMLYHMLRYEKTKWKKIFFNITLVIMLVTIVLTFTRGVWIAFSAAVFMVSIVIPRMRKLLIMVLLLSSLLVFYLFYSYNISATFKTKEQTVKEGERFDETISELFIKRAYNTSTLGGRLELILINLQLFADSPIWGYGYGSYESAKEAYLEKTQEAAISSYHLDISKTLSHNTMVGILVDLGLIGFCLLLYIIFYLLRASLRLYGRADKTALLGKDLGVIFIGILLMFIIGIQTFEIRFFLFVNSMFCSIAGLVVGQYHRISRSD